MPKAAVLSEEQKNELHRQAAAGDIAARNVLIELNLGFATAEARKCRHYGLPMEDMIQEACIGMIVALRKFDPSMGLKFTTFAVHYIRQHLFDYVIKNLRMVNIATTKDKKKLFFAFRGLKAEGLSNEQIAETLNVSLKDVDAVAAYFRHPDAPLLKTREDGEEEEYLPSRFDMDYVIDEIDSASIQQAVHEAVSNLNPRERDIIESRWLSEKREILDDLAVRYGVSAERIRQIEAEAMWKIGFMVKGSAVQ